MSEIEAAVGRLEAALRNEEDLYLRMRALLRREESEIVELDPRTIQQTVEEKRALAEEGRLLEESRAVLANELAARVGLSSAPPKLSSLIAELGEESGELPALHARLSALVGSVRALVEANQHFADRSLGRVQETLRLLGRSLPQEPGYGPATSRSPATGRGRLVRQAI